jgi:hypothetical protein
MITAIWILCVLLIAEFVVAPINPWTGRMMPLFTRSIGYPPGVATKARRRRIFTGTELDHVQRQRVPRAHLQRGRPAGPRDAASAHRSGSTARAPGIACRTCRTGLGRPADSGRHNPIEVSLVSLRKALAKYN